MGLDEKYTPDGHAVIQHHTLRDFKLLSGATLDEARLGYCVYGANPDNPVVVVHPALTGSPRAHLPEGATQGDGWWSRCIGPGKFLDTQRLNLFCVDHLGGNGASTGARELGERVGDVNFGDTIRLTAEVLAELGVRNVHAVIGGSIGGGQALEWLRQDTVGIERIFEISGNSCREGPAIEFFQITADLLRSNGDDVPKIKERLIENCRSLRGHTRAFDHVFEYILAGLDALARNYTSDDALRIARKIGFLRFVTPYHFQRRWDHDIATWTDEAVAVAGINSWIDYQGEQFVRRFNGEALAALCAMEAKAEVQNPEEIAALLQKKQCTLAGFSVNGDLLFDAEAQFQYYKEIRRALPEDGRARVDIFFAYDEVNGHDHFLTERFLENVPGLAKRLYDHEKVEGFATRAIHKGQAYRQETGALIPPVYLTSTFEKGNREGFDYTRSGNPNFINLENILASLENAAYATVFASGVSAISAVVSSMQSGDLVIAEEVIYGCTYRLFEQVFSKFGLRVEYYDFTDPANFDIVLQKKPKLVWIESPTNPLLKVIDIRELSKFTTRAGSTLLVDNTFASSYHQKPLDLGADLSLSSTTKYINGHSDVLGGVICTNSDTWKEKNVFAQKALGLHPAPFDTWLITRGLKTLSLRMGQHSANALAVADYLDGLEVTRFVRYPMHPSHPQYEVAKAQMSGGSGIVTAQFDLPFSKIGVFLNALERFTLAESLGGIESLVCHPATMSHASVPKEQRERLGITDTLLRFSVGVEQAEDLIADIARALKQIGVDG